MNLNLIESFHSLARDDKSIYVRGGQSARDDNPTYVRGGQSARDDNPTYVRGGQSARDDINDVIHHNYPRTSALNRAVAAVSCCAEKRDLLLEL